MGVGAVLSQRATSDDKVHPCAFFSHRLSPAERNYDIGNRELLAVKLALEEWRHWLEGSGVPFIVWTDHKNLEYIQSATRLNSRQARWALFFGRFDFSISYRPGSKNIKPDALSRIFDISDRPVSPECIIPERLVVSAVTWEIESKVRTALEGVMPPPGCPTGRLFVPEGLRSNVIQWGHCSNVAVCVSRCLWVCVIEADWTLAAHCFPALPASALRKAPFLPTESSASAYGSSASALRKAPFSFSLCITSCNKLSFRN